MLLSFIYNLRFPGRYYQAETGVNYNYFRDLDTQTGRYIESDPIGLRGGSFSTYTYVGGSPISRADALGLSAADVAEILQYAEAWTLEETVKGNRTDPGLKNDLCLYGYIFGIAGCPQTHSYKGCMVQADDLQHALTNAVLSGQLNLDDAWDFFDGVQAILPHAWVWAQSSNSSDPLLKLDPWNNRFGAF